MKFSVLLLPMFLIACGNSDGETPAPSAVVSDDLRQSCVQGAGQVNGVYYDAELNKLILYGSCLGVTEDACNHNFTYYKPVGGKMLINVVAKTTSSDQCLPLGETVCDVEHLDPGGADNQIALNCGKGTVVYFADGTF